MASDCLRFPTPRYSSVGSPDARRRRWSLASLGLLALLGLASRAAVSEGPQSGLLVRLVQEGIRHSEEGRHREAINALEEAWELDPSNPTVAEHLALSYLYEEHPPSGEAHREAARLMRFSLEHGGQVHLPARHLHKGWQWFTTVDDSCPGRFVVSADGVHFLTDTSNHTFSLRPQEIGEISLTKKKSPEFGGIFQLRASDGKRYELRTGTRTRAEAQILVSLVSELTIGG